MPYDIVQYSLVGNRDEIHAEHCVDFDHGTWQQSGEAGLSLTHHDVVSRLDAVARTCGQRLFPHSAFDDPTDYLADVDFGVCLKDMPIGTPRDGHPWKAHNASLAADAVRLMGTEADKALRAALAAQGRFRDAPREEIPAPGRPDLPPPPDLFAEHVYTARLHAHWNHVTTETSRYKRVTDTENTSHRRYLSIALHYAARLTVDATTSSSSVPYTSRGGDPRRRGALFALAYGDLLGQADLMFIQTVHESALRWTQHNGGTTDGQG